MKRQLWELSVAELEHEIGVAEKILTIGGPDRQTADHLAALQEQLEERHIEDTYGGDAA